MAGKAPIKLEQNEVEHWSRVHAAVVAQFNWAAKRKVNKRFVTKLAAEIADDAVLDLRVRVNK